MNRHKCIFLPAWLLLACLFVAPTYAVSVPTISTFTPTSTYEGDFRQQITINGTNFTGTTAVSFTGLPAVYTVVSSTKITAVLPEVVISGPISVTTPGGSVSSTQDFEVLPIPAPTVSSFTPNTGYVDDYGQEITITGTNFASVASTYFSGATDVTIGGWGADFTIVNATTIKAMVPQGVSTGKVAVTTSGGTATSAGNFTVVAVPVPTISSFTPEKCYAGEYGKVITIKGTNFKIVGNHIGGDTSVTIGGWGAACTVVDNTTITVILPQGVTTGPIVVSTAGGMAASAKNFQVITVPAPLISSFTPDGAAAGSYGQEITIKGHNFIGLANASTAGTIAVSFDGWNAQFTVVDDATIKAILPQGVTTGPIEVTTSGGSVQSATDFIVYQPTSFNVTITTGSEYKGAYENIALTYILTGADNYTGSLVLDHSGKGSIKGLRAGTYTLSLDGSHWLKRVFNNITVDGISGQIIELTNGDADGDNMVNLFDFVVLDSHFGSSYAMADLDGDGLVNLFDYVIIDQNFGAQGDL